MPVVASISQQIWDMKYRLKGPSGEAVDRTIEDNGVEAELNRLGEAVTAVVLREVVQQPETDRRRTHSSTTSNIGSAA